MIRRLPIFLVLLTLSAVPLDISGQQARGPALHTAQTITSYDAAKDLTTVRLAPVKISGDRAHYHSLSYSVFYSYPGKFKRVPEKVSLELLTVVKRRLLKIDLYVVFLIDGEKVFLSSSRSAIKHPVPGKRWIGERLEFRMPYETFLSFTRASKLAVSMDGIVFDFAETDLQSLRDFAQLAQPAQATRLVPMESVP